MINKNQAKSSEPKLQQESPSRSLQNSTIFKQKESMMRFQQDMQPQLEVGPPRYDPEIEDSPIEPEQDHLFETHAPQGVSVSSPRRSLIRQKEIWSTEEKVAQTSRLELLFASDQYYNENVPQQTLLFLEKLRSILVREEETLIDKRRGKLQAILASIRAEFARLREELTVAVQEWCRRTEEAEVEDFVQRGELTVSGEMLELTARLAARREEIEQRIAELNEGLTQSQLTAREETLRRNHLVKRAVKQVWARDYEHEVSQLQEEAFSLKSYESKNRTLIHAAEQHERQLHSAIHQLLAAHEPFELPSARKNSPMPLTPPVQKKYEEESLSPPSTHRQQVLQSLMEERMREIDLESKRMISQYRLGP